MNHRMLCTVVLSLAALAKAADFSALPDSHKTQSGEVRELGTEQSDRLSGILKKDISLPTEKRSGQRKIPVPPDPSGKKVNLPGLVVNFHIPYPGVEQLALSLPRRAALAHEAIKLKRRGLPILNSYAGLRALARNDWRRPLDLSVVTDCRDYYSCCRARGNERICRECGYAGWAELALVLQWNVASVLDMLRKLHRR